MRFVFTLFSILFSLALAASELDSLRTEQREGGLYVIHRVEEEETLYSLARRYESSVSRIISDNEISNNRIEIGQELAIPVSAATDIVETSETEIVQHTDSNYHVVEKGETLYSISKKYNLKVRDLKEMNDLKGNELSLGMQLLVGEQGTDSSTVEIPESKIEPAKPSLSDSTVNEKADLIEHFESYLVQTGETLYSISDKVGVAVDSLRKWNRLKADYLRIGQELLFKKNDSLTNVDIAKFEKNSNKNLIDENGFERIFEEGIAAMIESMETARFLALHRKLPIGTDLEVRNLMNNLVVHVKVIGRLPDTGLNKNVMVRLSKPAYQQLGILDSKSRVEVSYFKK